MFIARTEGPVIARIPKNASQSVSSALSPFERLTPEEALRRDLRVMFIRNPYDRLASLFSFFAAQRANRKLTIRLDFGRVETYEEMIDIALLSDDPHCTPQYEQAVTSDGVFVPNCVHKLEDIGRVWTNYFHGMIPHRNDSERLPVNDGYRRTDIETRYAKDFELWKTLNGAH